MQIIIVANLMEKLSFLLHRFQKRNQDSSRKATKVFQTIPENTKKPGNSLLERKEIYKHSQLLCWLFRPSSLRKYSPLRLFVASNCSVNMVTIPGLYTVMYSHFREIGAPFYNEE